MSVEAMIEQVDTDLRNGASSKDIAATLNVGQTRLYPYLEARGVAVATVKFLVDTKTGKPLRPVGRIDVTKAGNAAKK